MATQIPDGKLHLIFCDIGQGDASLIVKGDFQMLIDTGPKNGGVVGCLSKHMPFWDRKVEVVVNSHPQTDHFGDLEQILRHYEVVTMVLSDVVPVGKAMVSAYESIERNNIKQYIARKGDRIRYGDLYFDVLWPEENRGEPVLSDSNQANGRALVLSLTYRDFGALFTGDIGEAEELALVAEGVLGPIDVLKVAHHGSKYSSSLAFDEKIRPKWAVVSVGAKNTYGHPAAEILKRFELLGSHVWRTDQQGEAEFVADDRIDEWHLLQR